MGVDHVNYQIILDKTIEQIKKAGERPRLLLHACCAPCSSYVLEYLSEYFEITLFFYNPNISPRSEYDMRLEELRRLTADMGLGGEVTVVNSDYTPELFREMAKGLEHLPEGGERCRRCYAMRLRKASEAARAGGYDYFTTTLSISPHKNAAWLNDIGARLSEETGVKYLFSDFKKKGGYLRSCELSKKYDLYRQSFCGCVYSKIQSKTQNEK
ncbi:MAG: epoxyqueuosine reductase QueH [Clostridia bacterium]|nr:epoxyqueuosine reductase QueH [Clostridia bacterium]